MLQDVVLCIEEGFRLATTTDPDAKYIVFQENMRGACLTLIATEGLGVTYYVADTFELRHSDAETLRSVEARVEADNLQRVRRRCSAERASKQRMVDAANQNKGEERSRAFEAADAVAMRWCDEKDRLETARA